MLSHLQTFYVEENHVSGDPNLLDSPVEETSESKLPSSINFDSPEKNEEQDISKYPGKYCSIRHRTKLTTVTNAIQISDI